MDVHPPETLREPLVEPRRAGLRVVEQTDGHGEHVAHGRLEREVSAPAGRTEMVRALVRGSVTMAPAVNRRSSRLTTAATEKGPPVVRRQYEQWQ